MSDQLDDAEKLHVATALVLLKDWLQQNRGKDGSWAKEALYVLVLAKKLGVTDEVSEVMVQMPPMEITER